MAIGKVLLDATNPLTPFPGLEVGTTRNNDHRLRLRASSKFVHRPHKWPVREVSLNAALPLVQVRWGHKKSGGEVIAEALPETAVFKAFNTIGAGRN